MPTERKPETAIAAPVVEYLQAEGWEVFPEVKVRAGYIADIVGRRGKLLWTVEVKASLSLEVLGQAYRWRGWSHLVSVAVPAAHRNSEGRYFARRICKDYGIGWLSVGANDVRQVEPPAMSRVVVVPGLAESLCEEQKTYTVAGSAGRDAWSPFKQTCQELARIATREPGISLRAAIEQIRHHYASTASARASLRTWIEAGKVPGLRLERDGRSLRLFRQPAAA